jgi:membrane-associated phospholipid phosphatase
LVTVLAAIGVHLMWVFFVNSAAGQRIDRAAFEGAAFEQGRLWQVAQPVLNVVSYALVIGGAAAAVLIAIFRKRVLLALELLALIGGANLTTQLIKDWYPRPHLLPGWTGPNSLPSGHTTVAASVSAALLLAVPRRWRPVVALLGAGWTIAIGLSTLVGQWHRPADVIAAVLVVLAWGALICALTSFHTMDQAEDELRGNLVWKRRWPYRLTPTVSTTSWVVGTTMTALAAIGLTVWIVVIWRLLLASPDVSDYFVTAYGGGAAGVVGFTLASFAVLLVVRQATGAPRSVEI